MTLALFYSCIGVALWLIGLQGVMLLKSALRRIVAINLMSTGVFMVMVAMAARDDLGDPVLHALVVTGLVVAVSATALALRLATADADKEKSGSFRRGPKSEPRA